jgi:hypothetical protein
MKHSIAVTVFSALLAALPGCTYYVPAGGTAPGYPGYPSTPSTFDRSFSAASSAMRDQGLAVSVEDRASGTVVGSGGGGTVTATLRQQADGSVRVQFDSSGVRDPGLIDRVSSSYNQRMGR